MADQLTRTLKSHTRISNEACMCGWRTQGQWPATALDSLDEEHAGHLASVVRRHLMAARLPWSSGIEARNTGMAMAQARADEVAADGWLPGVDDVPEGAREGWDR